MNKSQGVDAEETFTRGALHVFVVSFFIIFVTRQTATVWIYPIDAWLRQLPCLAWLAQFSLFNNSGKWQLGIIASKKVISITSLQY